jgi:glutathionylspermidine synthase
MKKIALSVICVVAAFLLSSCGKEEYQRFVGTWGVEKIVYESYNTDYAGEPIEGSIETETYMFDPNKVEDGIQMVFKADKTGELHDNAIDTIYYVFDDNDSIYVAYTIKPAGFDILHDSILPCADSTFVTRFTYSFDETESVLYLTMSNANTFRMVISGFEKDAFTYENVYAVDEEDNDKVYKETADLKRISKSTPKPTNRQTTKHPNKRGSFLGGF